MKTVKKIFLDDVIGLAKNFFALVIVIGICFLPALYAWFNIYSNWDPYGNTGALKFAAISLDKGFTDENGEYHNQGDTIIENLHENTAVDWQFVDSQDAAIEGVNSGEYYAAVVIDEDFTYNMYNVLTEAVERPTLHFYENQKKNPVATKISDTVVQSLQNNINVAFTEVVVSKVFSSASDYSEELQEEGGVDKVIDKLKAISADLTRYQTTIDIIIENDTALKKNLSAAKNDASNIKNQAEKSADAMWESAGVSAQSTTTLDDYSKTVSATMEVVNSTAVDMQNQLNEAKNAQSAETIKECLEKVYEDISIIQDNLQVLSNGLEKYSNIGNEIPKENIESVQKNLRELSTILEEAGLGNGIVNKEIKKYADLPPEEVQQKVNDAVSANAEELNEAANYDVPGTVNKSEEELKKVAVDVDTKFTEIKDTLDTKINPAVNSSLNSLTETLVDANSLLNSVGTTFGNLMIMFDSINGTVDCANVSLEKTGEAISYVNGRLIEVIEDVEQAGESEKIQVLINALSGDPEVYGKFFSTPVEVVTEAVYPIENYGSAVAPFYSTLAFWVGALILTAIIKVKPDKAKYPNASQRQLYFGRYALYWVLGQIQAVVIVAGDILLLHVQCIHPWLFLFAGSVIATTFTLLIYSLVVTWGDAGKALAVVLVVIQIAGSSGTYPIELLPEFFKKVYIFFPFPYAINAIRECLCGMYKLDYLKYLATLLIFMGVSLVIGLLIRIPFEPINHYMEERMEDTEMM